MDCHTLCPRALPANSIASFTASRPFLYLSILEMNCSSSITLASSQLCHTFFGSIDAASTLLALARLMNSFGLGKLSRFPRSRTLSDNDFVVSSSFIVPTQRILSLSSSGYFGIPAPRSISTSISSSLFLLRSSLLSISLKYNST